MYWITSWKLPLLLLMSVALSGCITGRSNPSATQPATSIELKRATVDYWLAQPATARVEARDINLLWDTCERVARRYFFRIDRRDYRARVLSTEPVISKQFFELWRKDAGTAEDVKEASLGTVRRTIFFEFAQNKEGGYTVSPKVVVERQSRVDSKYHLDPQQITLYWYALRRDKVMEQNLAQSVREAMFAKAPPLPSTSPAVPEGERWR
jgi:hypothetical protein